MAKEEGKGKQNKTKKRLIAPVSKTPSCPGLSTEQLLSLTDVCSSDESELPALLQSFAVPYTLVTSGTPTTARFNNSEE